jgi:dihydrolipoamide dehydrogenase
VKTDDRCRTNIPNVYAAGDITGFSLLAHTASREGEVAVNNICGIPDRMRYSAIPSIVYTNPEIACVGITEEEAKAKKIAYKVSDTAHGLSPGGLWLKMKERTGWSRYWSEKIQ